MPPRRLNLLLEDHPARATLYTANEDMARKKSRPISRSDTSMDGAIGMTANDASVVTMMIAGAMMNTALSANGGIQFSLVKIFTMSATTWRTPNGPARLGPYLSWKDPRSRRSTHMTPAAMSITPTMTPMMTMTEMPAALMVSLRQRCSPAPWRATPAPAFRGRPRERSRPREAGHAPAR